MPKGEPFAGRARLLPSRLQRSPFVPFVDTRHDRADYLRVSVAKRTTADPSRGLILGVLLFALASALGGVFHGPALGDHEAIVAQCAREMRLSGDWLVPQFLDSPFIRKPPLPVWIVAGASYLFADDPATGLPVTPAASRLPSAICAFLSILLLWNLGANMFGRWAGLVTAIVAASSIAFLLYAPNATAEMPLVFCCVWAYYHFWFAATTRSRKQQFVHALAFYVALGFGMLAKGPAPVALVGFPLAVWWFVHRPLRILARSGMGAWREAVAFFFRDLAPRAIRVFTQLWFIPGIFLFALLFIPWMMAVADRHPHAWALWDWQFLQRAKGDFPDTRHRSVAYYVPILGGLVLPWTFLVIEAAIAPWVKRYARLQRPLLFAGLWALLGTLAMSLMEFKKPYYILPAAPGLILLVAVAAERAFVSAHRAAAWATWPMRAGLALQLTAIAGATWLWRSDGGAVSGSALAAASVVALVLFGGATFLFRRGRAFLALSTVALVTVLTFHTVWNGFGATIDNIDKISLLASTLDNEGVPRTARVFWADRRPDARLSFYFNRRAEHMVDPHEIVGAGILDRGADKHLLEQMAVGHALQMLRGAEPVYLILRRDHYERLSDTLSLYADLVATVEAAEEVSRHNWMIVTNASRVTAAP